MARLNQFAGRTSENWKARYAERRKTAQLQAEALQAKGVKVELLGSEHEGGGGIPGGAKNIIAANVNGRKIGRHQLRQLCVSHGIELDCYSRPV